MMMGGCFGGKRARNIVIASVVAAIFFASLALYAYLKEEMPAYRYHVIAHFIDGSQKEMMVTSKSEPTVRAYNGTYYLATNDGTIIGVVRCEVIGREVLDD